MSKPSYIIDLKYRRRKYRIRLEVLSNWLAGNVNKVPENEWNDKMNEYNNIQAKLEAVHSALYRQTSTSRRGKNMPYEHRVSIID